METKVGSGKSRLHSGTNENSGGKTSGSSSQWKEKIEYFERVKKVVPEQRNILNQMKQVVLLRN